MRLVTIDSREAAGRPGACLPHDEILDLHAAPITLSQAQWLPQSVVSILAAGESGLAKVQNLLRMAEDGEGRAALRSTGAILPFAGTALLPPVRRPGLLLLTERLASTGKEPMPVALIKSPNTATGPGSEIRPPWRHDEGVVATAMLAAVTGRPLYRATPAEAEAAIAAYTLLIDVSLPAPAAGGSATDWRRYVDSKQFPGACPIGPALLTVDELAVLSAPPPVALSINGVETDRRPGEWQAGAAVLSSLSQRYAFRPGDVVGLGETALGEERLRPGDELKLTLGQHLTLEARYAA